MIENCAMRHQNGNCLPAGGFCFCDYNKEICKALHNAYDMGRLDCLTTIKEELKNAEKSRRNCE